MAEVKWIKITTDMFDNRKIKHLRKMPEGNSIVLIWVMLLTMAGRCNAGGMIFLTENIPYTPKMLADELDFDESIVRLALVVLEQLDMIRTDDFLYISGWDEHQNVDGMEKIREQNRVRVARHREKQKQLVTLCNVTDHYSVTPCNATEEESEEEKESEIDIDPPLSPRKKTDFENPFTGELHDALDDWIAYKKEKRQPYKPQGLKSLITQIRNNAEKYGEAAVAGVISDSMASNYQGIVFDRLEKSAGKQPQRGTRAVAQDYEGSKDFFDVD